MDENAVRALCEAADLPVGKERLPLIAPELSVWIEAANELSRTMAAPQHAGVVPVTVFRHPTREGGDE